MSIIDPKYIRKTPRPMVSVPLTTVDLDSNRDVLGEFFAARDQAKREQRFTEQLGIKRLAATRPAGTPLAAKPRKVIRITDQRVKQIIQASTQPKQPPTPIKSIERAPNPLIDQYKDKMEALFSRVNRVINNEPEPNEDQGNGQTD